MIATGYEDGNDAGSLRSDPLFKMARDLSPSDRELCSQSTISRLENLPDARALLRMGGAMIDLYCGSFRQVPKRITLDTNETFDAVHGGQQYMVFSRLSYSTAPAASSQPCFVPPNGRAAKRSAPSSCCGRSARTGRARWPQPTSFGCSFTLAPRIDPSAGHSNRQCCWNLWPASPRRSMWRAAQFDTLRLRLIKVAARVVETKTMIRVHLPTSCPAQDILRLVLRRIARLVT
jgi:hypothetical protein